MQIMPVARAEKTKTEKKFEEMKKKYSGKNKKYRQLSFRQATKIIYEREGIKGYYRGFFPSVGKAAFAAGIYFGALSKSKHVLGELSDNTRHVNICSALIARFFQCIFTNPIYVIKTRFEVIGFNEYTSIYDAFNKVMKNEGAKGFFQGLSVALLRDLPFSGLYYPLYEESKVVFGATLGLGDLNKYEQNDKQKLIILSACSAMNANVISCLITHPIDIIRTRILFRFYNKDPEQRYSNMADAVRKIYKHDGMQGFFRGMIPRVMRKGFGNVISWSAYEYLVDKRKIKIS